MCIDLELTPSEIMTSRETQEYHFIQNSMDDLGVYNGLNKSSMGRNTNPYCSMEPTENRELVQFF